MAAARTLVLDRVAVEVSEALAAVRIPSLVLRGPSLLRWVYPRGAGRSYLDVDLLVPPTSLPEAERVVAGLGFEHVPTLNQTAGDRPVHARTWRRPSDGAVVDLHRTLIGVGVDDDAAWRVLSRASAELELGSAVVQGLDAPGTALVVTLHAAQHGSRIGGPIDDLQHALERVHQEDWRAAAGLASNLAATEAFAAGLRLAEQGRALADELGLSRRSSAETVIRAATPVPMALGFDWLAQVPGARARARLVARKLVPDREFMRTWAPIARRGPLGLALAYLYRPVWLARHAPAGFREWRRARRVARS